MLDIECDPFMEMLILNREILKASKWMLCTSVPITKLYCNTLYASANQDMCAISMRSGTAL